MVAEALTENPPLRLPAREMMETSFLDYSLSVIFDRALPEARDGLKPVHRRILFSMFELGLMPNSAHKKSARVVGDVIGKYHPHGDSAAYGAAVRMAQPWAMRHPLIDGQGNFGSIDGDAPAAMRYTEMRLSKMGAKLFTDIAKNTVDFRDNFDGSEREPTVLPLSYPNLWVNGAEGIAVGMATSIPPHNLGETASAFLAWLDNPQISTRAIMEVMPGPDFPTGGILHGLDGYAQALETGRGSVKLRARWQVEERTRGAKRLVITEIPYAVNKAKLVEQMAELIKEKEIEGVVDMRDESNKAGLRIVLDVKAGAEPELIAMQLVARTNLEVSVPYNVMALVGQTPVQLGIREVFEHFRAHRIEVIQRRTQFDLDRSLERLHILEGYLKALDCLDDTIRTIRASNDPATANAALMQLLGIDQIQAQAILDLKLQRLTGMQILDIREEHARLTETVADLRDILARPERQLDILRDTLVNLCDQHATPRATEIDLSLSRVSAADLVPEEQVLILGTQKGYLKRLPAEAMNRQNRGTKGRSVMALDDDDLVTTIHTGNSHDVLLALTDAGQVHAIKVYDIPDNGIGGRGRHYRNIFEDLEGTVVALLSVPDLESEETSLVIFTADGLIKRTALSHYTGATRRGGVRGITVTEGDRIVCARLSRESDAEDVMIVADNSKAIRFPMGEVRGVGRAAQGVRGLALKPGEQVLSASVIHHRDEQSASLLVVTENGLGKATPVAEFRRQARAGQGVTAHTPTRRSGRLVAATVLFQGEDVVVFNTAGGANRVSGDHIPRNGRAAAGAAIIRNGTVASVLAVPPAEDALSEG